MANVNTESFHLADDGRTPVQAHTRGPWRVLPAESDKPYLRVRGTKLGYRYKVANVIALTYDGALPADAEETAANARLIAAAPDMLTALQCASNVLFLLADEVQALGHNAGNVRNMVRAAIEAATGDK